MSAFGSDFLQKLEYLALVARRVYPRRLPIERRQATQRGRVEFADHRCYTPGDDDRYLDWNVYARTDDLAVKLFEPEHDLHVYLLLDVSASMATTPAKRQAALQVTAGLAYLALSHLDRVAVYPFARQPGPAFPLTRGKGRILSLLNYLNSLEPVAGGTDLARCARALLQRRPRRGLLVLISDLYDPDGPDPALDILRHQRDAMHVVHLTDPTETAPLRQGLLELVDAETAETRRVAVDAHLHSIYTQVYESFLSDARQACLQRGIGYTHRTTDVPFTEIVLNTLRESGGRP